MGLPDYSIFRKQILLGNFPDRVAHFCVLLILYRITHLSLDLNLTLGFKIVYGTIFCLFTIMRKEDGYMQYTEFHDAVRLSRLGMGAMRLPVKQEEPGTPIDREKAQEIIEYAMRLGVNYFDTAYVYHNGESEVFLGEALSKYPRESYYLADKFNAMANPNYAEQFHEQLSRLKTDYIDFYLLHGVQDQFVDACSRAAASHTLHRNKRRAKFNTLAFRFTAARRYCGAWWPCAIGILCKYN